MTENEFILEDRKTKIKSVIEKYGEENFYLSFSGGKDSTVLNFLLDEACPGNNIPRVFCNTGIEYNDIVNFVRTLQQKDKRIIVINPKKPIKKMLETAGYPFKSKEHSFILDLYQRKGSLPTVTRYLNPRADYGERFMCPQILKHQFSENYPLKVSDSCCRHLKKEPLEEYAAQEGKKIKILGIMKDEGGRRKTAKCLVFKADKISFNPLAVVSKAWEEWLIKKYNIELCRLYKPPFNFERTGCKGCPYNVNLQNDLNVLAQFLPAERKQCEYIWAPVYTEYRKLNYRLDEQMNIFDYMITRKDK